ncbi:MAG TPA: hypothetical protein VHV78_15655 [Gemmatimonadaceae bacterium]|jgi:8-oxo-dGTP diphosphatase|nr:hypothetical protein [Gemmatimonadaceae bacterium]
MPERSSHSRPAGRGLVVAVDIAIFTPRRSDLAVLLVGASDARLRTRDRWGLPSTILRADESPDDAAERGARAALGAAPSLVEQAASRSAARAVPRSGGRRAARGGSLTGDIVVSYFALFPPPDAGNRTATSWAGLGELPSLDVRARDSIAAGFAAIRARVDVEPLAFHLLGPAFTLSELQTVYELLLGRRLHKASFRRSLHGAALVEAMDEWRSEGRGRPAQLFRYAPRRRRKPRRGIRFDLL